MLDLSIIIPAYNEEKNLLKLLPEIHAALANSYLIYEILVIDTLLPMDSTESICVNHEVNYIKRENSNLFGDAIRTGIKHAKGEWILFMDADGSHDAAYIETLLADREEHDVIVASRYVSQGVSENSFTLVLMSQLVNRLYSFVLQIPCKDISTNFKLYRANTLKNITLMCNHFDILPEMLFKLKNTNPAIRIKEIPITFKRRHSGLSKRRLMLFIINYAWSLFRLKFTRI